MEDREGAEHVVYKFENCVIDTASREVTLAGRRMNCEPKQYEVLLYLAERPGQLIRSVDLYKAVWGDQTLSEGVLRKAIWGARKSVGDDAESERVIRTLKGFGYSFVAPLVRTPPPPSRLPESSNPPIRRTNVEPPLEGRYLELAKLEQLLQLAADGTPQIALITGEAGTGKTRLIEEFAARARRRGAEVLIGRVPQESGVPPYWLWRDLFEPFFATRTREQLEQALLKDASVLAELFYVLRERFPDLGSPDAVDPAQGQYRLFSAVLSFVRGLSASRPLVVILEDVHWADPSSLSLLHFLAQSQDAGRLLALAAFRTSEVSASDPRSQLQAAIAAQPSVTQISLAGLDSDETVRLATNVAGRPIKEWTDELVRRTEGNPLTVIELVCLLDDLGAFDRIHAPTRFPSGAQSTIARRLDRLSNLCTEVLTRASIFGRNFDLDLLKTVSQLSEDDLLRAIEEACAKHVIEPHGQHVGQYRFRHALLQEVIYGRLSSADRVRLHRLAGRALQERYHDSPQPPLAALIHHLSLSAFKADIAKASEFAQRAAEEAMRMLAYPEAIDLYQRALDCSERSNPGDRRLGPLLQGLGLAQRGAGRHMEAMETFRRLVVYARSVPDAALLAEGAVGLEDARYTARGAAASSIPLLEEALRGLSSGTARAQILERLAGALIVVNDPRRLEVSRQALQEARDLDDPLMLGRALATRHLAIWAPDSLEERLGIVRELLALAEHVGSGIDSFGIGGRIWGHERHISDLLEMGRLEALLRAIEAASVDLTHRKVEVEPTASLQISEDTRLAVHVLNLRMVRGTLLVLQGRFAEAQAQLDDISVQAQAIEAGNVLMGVYIQTFGLRYLQGRVVEVLGFARASLAANSGFSHSARGGLALCMAYLGQSEEAHSQIDHLARDRFSHVPKDGLWVSALTMIAEAMFLLQSSRHAHELYPLLLPYANRTAMCSVSYCAGSVERYLGELATLTGDHAAAAQHFKAAIKRNQALKAAPLIAMTQYDYALLLARSHSPAARRRALALLKAAQHSATKLDLRYLVERIGILRVQIQAPDLDRH